MWRRVRHRSRDAAFPTPAAADTAGQNLTTDPVSGSPVDRVTSKTTSTMTPLVASVPASATPTRGAATQVTDPPAETSFVAAPAATPLDHLPEPVCASGTAASDLTAFFDGGDPLLGADYQRAYPLPGGRVLWLFQDAFLSTSHGPQLVHNVGLLQSGRCFQLLRNGSADAPTPYLLPELTDRFERWFWPLGGDLGNDASLHVFVAEMREHGSRYLTHVEPVATWLVTIDVVELVVVESRLAPDPSADLYGWSVMSQGDHSYLYAHCYRQFGYDPLWFDPSTFAHDLSCTAAMTVARIPRGEFDARPAYWNGSGWVDESDAAVAVIPQEDRDVNPTQIALLDGRFVAVTKVGDWWGETIVLDVAPAAEGPWRTVDTIPVEPECDSCNTYFASVVPYGADQNSFVVGLSCNTWGGHDHDHYTPTFFRLALPAESLESEFDGADPGELRP